eukprot:TRINITY_DN52_c0_g1_i1.p1 TRINITY_DN52_c0_g1~~TRINITY_DN52_c0_g1_i1.p1  ORF type:complete len:203 (+),score=63.30 TRINITY_DN52_c0_g1_i1:159-767(+)
MNQRGDVEYYAVEFVSNTTTKTTTTVCNNGSYHDMAQVLRANWKKVFDGLLALNQSVEKCTQNPSDVVAECARSRDKAVSLLNDLNSVLFQYQQAQGLQQFFAQRSPVRSSPQGSPISSPEAKRHKTGSIKKETQSRPPSPIAFRHQTRPSTSVPPLEEVNQFKRIVKEEPVEFCSGSSSPLSSPESSPTHSSKRRLIDLLN